MSTCGHHPSVFLHKKIFPELLLHQGTTRTGSQPHPLCCIFVSSQRKQQREENSLDLLALKTFGASRDETSEEMSPGEEAKAGKGGNLVNLVPERCHKNKWSLSHPLPRAGALTPTAGRGARVIFGQGLCKVQAESQRKGNRGERWSSAGNTGSVSKDLEHPLWECTAMEQTQLSQSSS